MVRDAPPVSPKVVRDAPPVSPKVVRDAPPVSSRVQARGFRTGSDLAGAVRNEAIAEICAVGEPSSDAAGVVEYVGTQGFRGQRL